MRYSKALLVDPDKLVNWVLVGHPFIQKLVINHMNTMSVEDASELNYWGDVNLVIPAVPPTTEAYPSKPGFILLAKEKPDDLPKPFKLIDCEMNAKFFYERWEHYRPNPDLECPPIHHDKEHDPELVDKWAFKLSLLVDKEDDSITTGALRYAVPQPRNKGHIKLNPNAPMTWASLLNYYFNMTNPNMKERDAPYNKPEMEIPLGLIRQAITLYGKDTPPFFVYLLLNGDLQKGRR